MNPASGEYVFGYPLIKKARINLPNNKKLHIEVKKYKSNEKAKAIQKVIFNKKEIPVTLFTHQQLVEGGKLILYVH
jgi:putative alpha-1,2-mannosidase